MFSGRDVEVMTKSLWNTAIEDAAQICEEMRPHGGRAFTEGQEACFAALSDAAANIRKLKRDD